MVGLGSEKSEAPRPAHRHSWWYAPPSITGKGYSIIRCSICGQAQVYR